MKSDAQLIIDEVYHRMRNNLQFVTGVIRKKGSEMNSEQTIDLIESVIIKITNMEVIHPCFEPNRFKKNNLNEVLVKLCEQMKSLHSFDDKEVQFEISTNRISLNTNTITFLSRIINELIINSYKHAFHNQTNGIIRIKIQKQGYNNYVLIYSDNGNSIKNKEQINASKSLGLEIVKLFVERLKGKINYAIKDGLEYTIDFKEVIN